MKKVIILFLIIIVLTSMYGLSAPPLCDMPSVASGFPKIKPVEESIAIIDGEFKIDFINTADKNVRINSVKIVNSVNQTECIINSILPINVNAGESFTIIGGECGIPDNKSTRPIQLYVNISYDTISPEGIVIKHISTGVIKFVPACLQEKQEGDILILTILFICLVTILLVVTLIKHKSKKLLDIYILIFTILVIIFLFTPLLWMLLWSFGFKIPIVWELILVSYALAWIILIVSTPLMKKYYGVKKLIFAYLLLLIPLILFILISWCMGQ